MEREVVITYQLLIHLLIKFLINYYSIVKLFIIQLIRMFFNFRPLVLALFQHVFIFCLYSTMYFPRTSKILNYFHDTPIIMYRT